MKHLLTCFLISDILWQISPIDKLDCEKENQMEREMLRVVKSRKGLFAKKLHHRSLLSLNTALLLQTLFHSLVSLKYYFF